jgi:hypothetical protein
MWHWFFGRKPNLVINTWGKGVDADAFPVDFATQISTIRKTEPTQEQVARIRKMEEESYAHQETCDRIAR